MKKTIVGIGITYWVGVPIQVQRGRTLHQSVDLLVVHSGGTLCVANQLREKPELVGLWDKQGDLVRLATDN